MSECTQRPRQISPYCRNELQSRKQKSDHATRTRTQTINQPAGNSVVLPSLHGRTLGWKDEPIRAEGDISPNIHIKGINSSLERIGFRALATVISSRSNTIISPDCQVHRKTRGAVTKNVEEVRSKQTPKTKPLKSGKCRNRDS